VQCKANELTQFLNIQIIQWFAASELFNGVYYCPSLSISFRPVTILIRYFDCVCTFFGLQLLVDTVAPKRKSDGSENGSAK
jgi:hypothetical protein